MANKIRVLVWDENPRHAPKELYPENIRGAVAEGLRELGADELDIRVASLDDPSQGITAEALAQTDVLLWWGHARHGEVSDETAAIVKKAVQEDGLGFIALHSAHYSKTFRAVVDAPGHLKGGWRVTEPPEIEEIRVCAPKHPIAEGVSDFVLNGEEMYGAPFIVPPPEVVVLQSYFPHGGEYFPTGICFTVGKGKDPNFESGPGNGVGEGKGISRVFYFRGGHETVSTYFDASVRKVLYNAVKWCAKRS